MMKVPQKRESQDNRKLPRSPLQIPVKLEVVDRSSLSPKVIFAYTSDIHQQGIGLKMGPEVEIGKDSEVIVSIDGVHAYKTLRVPARFLWKRASRSGFKFVKSIGELHDIIQKSSAKLEVGPLRLKTYYPYINDEDIDTRQYEYFPYADKSILDFRETRHMIMELKRGITPTDAPLYVHSRYALADSDLNRAALLSAHRAFLEFRKFSIERRRKILDDIRELLLLEKENILQLMIYEGHPRKLAEWEFSGMLTGLFKESLDYFQSEMLKTVKSQGKETLIVIRRPEGVFCVSPPKNASSSSSLIASYALLAGNTLVIKPPLKSPVSTIHLWRNVVGKALKANGAPRGTINIIVGNSHKFMDEWLESPFVRGVLYFGDSKKGIEIGQRIYEKGKKPILELTGNDFIIVWKDANIEKAADSLLDCFMGSTQICMVPKKALIHHSVVSEFTEVFLNKVEKLKIGLPSDPDTILSPVVKMNEFHEFLEDALQNGAELLAGGFRVNHLGEKSARGSYIQPTVVSLPIEKANMMQCVRKENFFPLLPLIDVDSGGLTTKEKDKNIFERMMGYIEQNDYGMRLSAWVQNPYYIRKFIEEAHCSGLLRINLRHTGFSTCLATHGGIGQTGGPFGEMNYVWQKTSRLQGIAIGQSDTDSPSVS